MIFFLVTPIDCICSLFSLYKPTSDLQGIIIYPNSPAQVASHSFSQCHFCDMLSETGSCLNHCSIYEFVLISLKLKIELFPRCSYLPISCFDFPYSGWATPTSFPLTTLCKAPSYINPFCFVMGTMYPQIKQSTTLTFVLIVYICESLCCAHYIITMGVLNKSLPPCIWWKCLKENNAIKLKLKWVVEKIWARIIFYYAKIRVR